MNNDHQSQGHIPKSRSSKPDHAERMAKAIEAAMPVIVQMWDAFPYAEMPGDDDIMTELRQSAQAYRQPKIRRP